MRENLPQVAVDFALFESGPFRRLWKRWGLPKALVESLGLRVVMVWTVTWLPLLVLALAGGVAFTGAKVPFLYDVQAHARFLAALPILIVAERVAHQVLTPCLGLLLKRGIIRQEDHSRFNAILASTTRWNQSFTVRFLLVAFVLVVEHNLLQDLSGIRAATWYGEQTASGTTLTLPGYWYVFVAIPIFHYVQARWYFRLILWFTLLARVARLDLHLVATHPDRCGGLGFLGSRLYAFVPFLFGMGAVFSGVLFNRILIDEGRLPEYWPEIAGQVGFSLLLVLGPLAAFLPCLMGAKRQGKGEYSQVANLYVREFEEKWVRGGAPPGEVLVGSADIQSLADLASSYQDVQRMKPLPFGRDDLVLVVVAIALPLLPLAFTMFPVQELIPNLFHMILGSGLW